MPLFALCAVAAPHRVSELKRCALDLTGSKAADGVESSDSLRLLSDIQKVWRVGAPQVFTASLLEKLKSLEESPWGESDLTARKLARSLHPFGVKSRQVRIGTESQKGYLLTDLQAVCFRYGIGNETCDTKSAFRGLCVHLGSETNV